MAHAVAPVASLPHLTAALTTLIIVPPNLI
jgi:hypothetical protein